MLTIQISNTHADAVGTYLTSQTPPRSWRIVERTGDHVEDVATCETDASRDEVQAAMDRSVDVRGDRCSAIEWIVPGPAVEQALAILRRPQHPEHVVQASALLEVSGSLDELWTRHVAAGYSPEVWAIAALAWHIRHAGTATIAQPASATDTMTVGIGGAKGLPAGLAEELAGMTPEDRAVAQRVSDLGEVEPSPGYEQRAADRGKREGVLPTP